MENINGAMIYDDGITREERREREELFLWPMEQRCERGIENNGLFMV